MQTRNVGEQIRGLHTVGVTFLATNDIPGTELNRPFQRTMNTPGSIPGFLFYPHVGQVQIEGPYDVTGAGETASRQAIFSCRPATSREEAGCARTIVSRLARRAFRRPITAADLRILMPFYQAGRGEDGTFDAGIEAALQRILADPEFIYRGEAEPAAVRPGQAYPIGDLALASRLSFFLWGTGPDADLVLSRLGSLEIGAEDALGKSPIRSTRPTWCRWSKSRPRRGRPPTS